MKIALCKSHFFGPVSGADESIVTYAISLHRAGYDVNVVLLYRPLETDRFYQRLRNAGVPVCYIIHHSIAFTILRGVRNTLSSLLLLILLIPHSEVRLRKIWQVLIDVISRAHYKHCREYFAESNYDVLHVFTPDTGAALMIRAGTEAGIPILYHEMGTPHYLPALNGYYHRLEKVLRLCSEVAALSPSLAKQWSERFAFLSSVSVLPLISEDIQTFLLPTPPITFKTRTIFGFAARIEEGKGPFVLLDALGRLRTQNLSVCVCVAGAGPALEQVKRRVRQLELEDSWKFMGAYNGAVGCSAFMRTLDVFVLPSYAEGTSKSVIEAMAHGLPVIATAVGGLPDLVTAETGILIQAGDSSALADAMQRLFSEPALRRRMGKAARQRYLELFTSDAVLPLLVSTYTRLAGKADRVVSTSVKCQHAWAANIADAEEELSTALGI
ncbi:MAG: glycosyltransferase [Pyrinomonadaceae bacterium]